MSRYNVVGVNDDKDFCECCGRQGLARVVWIEDTDTGEIKHFGTTCAASPVKGFGVDKEIKAAISNFNRKQGDVYRLGHHLYLKAGGKYQGNAQDGFKAIDQELRDKCNAEAKEQLK